MKISSIYYYKAGWLHGINIFFVLFNSCLGFMDLHNKYIQRYSNGRKASIYIYINDDNMQREESTINTEKSIFSEMTPRRF